ncbi:heavy-metal-associated domain-containing protein [Sclerotinia borealis F-4128]|uniref:Heavy-metal-associated domain-containing protein n=1 Tax=Sclerotinia borealis (strain F-4128) TaxID=1432307 RepID=W9C8U2_SCLBF|nr:heavy-metal-associated domain-containing protein [Sclerotinia borealis F-4128]
MADTEIQTPAPLIANTDEGEHTYKFGIAMSCGGCSGAVDRVLKKLDGVKAYEVNLKGQSATVIAKSDLDYETVLGKIVKTGKKVVSGEADGVERAVLVEEE